MNSYQVAMAAQHAQEMIAGGADPEGLVHILYYPESAGYENEIQGLSTPLPAGRDIGGYTSRYYTLANLAAAFPEEASAILAALQAAVPEDAGTDYNGSWLTCHALNELEGIKQLPDEAAYIASFPAGSAERSEAASNAGSCVIAALGLRTPAHVLEEAGLL